MKRIKDYISKPYPLLRSARRQIVLTVIAGLFIAVLFSIFYPFAPSMVADNVGIFIGFALVAMITGLLNTVILPDVFSSFFNEDSWTVGKEIAFSMFHLVSIAMAILIYGRLMGIIAITPATLLLSLFYTALFGIIPIAVKTLLAQNYYLNKHLKIAAELNDLLLQINYPSSQPSELTFASQGRKEHLKLRSDSLLCALAEQNYVKIVWKDGDVIKSELLRTSMKQVLLQIVDPFIIRCHRSFIVNLLQVENVFGNSQGYRLKLNGYRELVPVSRKLGSDVIRLLHRLGGQ